MYAPRWLGFFLGASFVLSPSFVRGEVAAPGLDRSRAIFSRLTGKPLSSRNSRYNEILRHASTNNWFDVALTATEDPSFITVTVRDLASYFTGRDGKQDLEINDAQSLVLGIARDHLDFRNVLTADFVYVNQNGEGIAVASPQTFLERLTKTSTIRDRFHDIDRAGIFNTEAWAKTHYDGGTNRRPVQHALSVFLCASQEEWKDFGVNPRRVRQDISRFPDLDYKNYQGKCRGCHSVLDGMAGAFASFDYKEGRLFYGGPLTVMPKYLQNAKNHAEGFRTSSSDWVNLATRSHNKQFGWRNPGEGIGLRSYAKLLAGSAAFSRCMAKKAAQLICDRSEVPRFKEEDFQALGSQWEGSGYDISKLFSRIAAEEKCIAPSL